MREFSPSSTVAPVRSYGATHMISRMASTEEQRRQTLDWALDTMRQDRLSELRFKVLWGRIEPTILDIKANIEHLAGDKPYYSIAKLQEFTEKGVEIVMTPTEVMARTIAEVAEMVTSGEL